MEKGSIDQPITARSVVTMVPTLVLGLTNGRRLKLMNMTKRAARVVEDARYNIAMLRWVENTARMHNHAFEVWHIAPKTEYNRLVFDGLVEALADYAQRGVASWEHYDEEQAMHILMGSPHIDAIYDADHDRLERRWRFRGYRVPYGMSP